MTDFPTRPLPRRRRRPGIGCFGPAILAGLANAACSGEVPTIQAAADEIDFGEWRHFADHREVEVTFPSQGTTLSGTLYLPLTGDSFTGLVINPGSAWEERDSWEDVAFTVSGAGAALFGFDKRGFGASASAPCPSDVTAHIECLALDVAAAVDVLHASGWVPPDRVGLLGSSHGGWVSPVAANLAGDRVSFLVIVNGGAVSSGQERIYDRLTGYGVCARSPMPMEEILDSLRVAGPSGFDPGPSVAALAQPVLWMFGERDYSHPGLFSIEVLDEVRETVTKDWTTLLVADANHDMIVGGSICQTAGPPADLLTPFAEWFETRW